MSFKGGPRSVPLNPFLAFHRGETQRRRLQEALRAHLDLMLHAARIGQRHCGCKGDDAINFAFPSPCLPVRGTPFCRVAAQSPSQAGPAG